MTPEQSRFFDACRTGNLAIAQQLFDADNNLVNLKDQRGFTPLIISVYNNEADTAGWLLQQGAAPDAQDASGNTALMGVAFKGYVQLVELLLQAGANVNKQNLQGATALSFAATFGQLQIAELLLQKGADIHLKDAKGKSPLAHAIIQENGAMIELLENYLQDKSN